MKERPILFSSEMIRAILDSKKSQTRRVVKPQPCLVDTLDFSDKVWVWHPGKIWKTSSRSIWIENCPYGVGDYLWVREKWATLKMYDEIAPSKIPLYDRPPAVYYKAWTGAAKHSSNRGRWRPSIHMPRWASRLTLEVVGVRVERLQDINLDGIKAEGVSRIIPGQLVQQNDGYAYTQNFIRLWDELNTKRGFGWDVNPWVWVVSFKKISP